MYINEFNDKNGNKVRVCSGIGGKIFFAARISENGSVHRIKSKYLPDRCTFDEAQEDLSAYARKQHWQSGGTYKMNP
ncbi:MAG: hypothetical protein IJU76_10360 [Desulfovibrionaceae bacterium]|nr:hypothetical protein [Desulfovibrionaceae bacterium]